MTPAITTRLEEFFTTHSGKRDNSLPATVDKEVFGPYRPNFRMQMIDSTFVISSIRLKDYKRENFKPGDVVLKVDGEQMFKLYDSLLMFVCGGNYWSNQLFGCNAVLSRYDTTTLFTLLRGDDTLQVLSKNMNAYDMFMANRKVEKENEDRKLYKWVDDSIAYIDIVSVTCDNIEENYNAIKSAAKKIIIDLRNYLYPSTLLAISHYLNSLVV